MRPKFLKLLIGALIGVSVAASARAEISSAYYTRWKSGLARFLSTQNEYVAKRALADVAEAGAQLPESERVAAVRFLRVAIRQGHLQNTSGFQPLLSPEMEERRISLLTELDKWPWTGGTKAMLDDLLDDLAKNGAQYDSKTLLYDALADLCRTQKVAVERIENVVRGFGGTDDGFLIALCLANRIYPSESQRWAGHFEARFSGVREAGRLAGAFGLLGQDIWKPNEKVSAAYRRNLADWLYANIPPSGWVSMDPDVLFEMVQAASAAPEEWEYKLLESLSANLDGRTRECLDQLMRRHGQAVATYQRIRPLLSARQDLFCFLHDPPKGVMAYLNDAPANAESSRKMLETFLDESRESQWDVCLDGLIKHYYETSSEAGQSELFGKAIRPILLARLDASFDSNRALNPVRKRLMASLTATPCFLQPVHHREAILPFMDRLDWAADLMVGDISMPDYQFVAKAFMTLGEKRASSKSAATDHVADLARWVDWMVAGMIRQPDRLNMGVDRVAESLREVCAAWRNLKSQYNIEIDTSTMRSLFANLEKELNEAAAEAQRKGAPGDSGAPAHPLRLIRAVRLALVISTLLEEEQMLPLICDIMRDKLFALSPRTSQAPRVLSADALRQEVDLFLTLDGDIADCLNDLATAPGTTAEMNNILRSFARRYHREIQLALLPTDGFLAQLSRKDGKLIPYRRYLARGSDAHPCALDAQGLSESFDTLTNTFDQCRFINSEDALAGLLDIYREAQAIPLWRNPLVFGQNENINLPVLLQLLRSESPPLAGDLSKADPADSTPSSWGNPVYLPVVDLLVNSVSSDPSACPIKSVEYNAQGQAIRTERYDPRHFIRRADLLLRAQELLSFPVITDSGPLAFEPQAKALAQSALSNSGEVSIPSLDVPADAHARRFLDGSRRAQLCSAVGASNNGSLRDALAAAECALMLPNAEINAAVPALLSQYDTYREDSYQRLLAKTEAETSSDALADALITLLRLDACRRGRGSSGDSKAIVARLSQRLSPAGRWRLLVETWAQAQRMAKGKPTPDHCDDHNPSQLTCRACRNAVAKNVIPRVSELEDVRRFCMEQAGVKIQNAPTNEWEAIAQLSRCIRRMGSASAEIEAIGPDAAKAAWYLVSQVKRAMQCIPSTWQGDWTSSLTTKEPLTKALTQLSRFSVATYNDILPVYGDIALDDLLGRTNQPANGDALVVYSVLNTEIKKYLLAIAPLEKRVEEESGEKLTTIDSPETLELVAVHSALQPLMVSEVWNRGSHPVRDGGPLMRFVVEGRSYSESFFDIDIVYEVGGSFSLSPRQIFDEAFRAIDLLVACAEKEVKGDRFVYDAWYGDLRTTMAKNGLKGREQFNMDRFLCQAADIVEDRRYEASGLENVRPFAEAFRKDLQAWMREGGTATMAELLRRAHSPAILTALAGRMGDRLGLRQNPGDPDNLDPLAGERLDAYAGFCRKTLFDTSGGRPVFPKETRVALCNRFSSDIPATNVLSTARKRFLGLFDADPVSAGIKPPRLGGLSGVYRRAMMPGVDEAASQFVGDFSFAYMQLISDLYWNAARDLPGTPRATNAVAICYPWRLDTNGYPYIDAVLPEKGLSSGALHTDSIRANIEWRAAAADRFQDIPFACRFFGGVPSSSQPSPSGLPRAGGTP